MNNPVNCWYKPKDRLPEKQENFGSSRQKHSFVVLLWVGANGYSHREVTIGYFDFDDNEWVYIEENFSDFPVIAWSYLPFTPASLDK